ncbi:DNA-binding transcriptional LysR family regulator [Bradyrhizobium sp. USDA 3650]
MDVLVNLQAFLATADAAGFSAAARKLNVATSVVAKRVTQLETRIGTPLFHRSTRQLRLTAAGQEYVQRGAERGRRCRRSPVAHGRERP